MTPSAAALLERLRDDRRYWHEQATQDEATTATRYMAQARRDLLDSLLRDLPRNLRTIEAEAVEEAMGVVEWLDEGAGVA